MRNWASSLLRGVLSSRVPRRLGCIYCRALLAEIKDDRLPYDLQYCAPEIGELAQLGLEVLGGADEPPAAGPQLAVIG